MAVEAHHLNLFPSQLIANREMMMMNPIDSNMNLYNAQMGYNPLLPSSGTAAATSGAGIDTLIPPAAYNSFVADSLLQKHAIKSESTLTYNNNNVPLSRKRSRETSSSINYSYPSSYATVQPLNNNNKNCGTFTFLGEDISIQIQQQQLDIDHLIAQRMEKVRVELEDKRKRQARRIMELIEVSVMKRLKSKDDEIEKIGKLNWALEEKVKSLCIENQIWRDLAQTNEATANALRTNLEQVLTQRGSAALDDDGATVCPGAAAAMDDAESCCGSSNDCDDKKLEENGVEQGWRTLAEVSNGAQDKDDDGVSGKRLCRNCMKAESCVLILPCRHLCLCTVCGSNLHICPVCKSFKTASVLVNMS